jgi:hypothetical protein
MLRRLFGFTLVRNITARYAVRLAQHPTTPEQPVGCPPADLKAEVAKTPDPRRPILDDDGEDEMGADPSS